jgi:hypothetical protein
MKRLQLKKLGLFLMLLAFSSYSFSFPAAADVAATSKVPATEITFVDQPIDFPSFFRPNGEQCKQTTCDWRDSRFGHGFIDYPRCELVDGRNCLKSIELSARSSNYAKLEFVGEINWNKINITSATFQMTGGAPSIWSSQDIGGKVTYFLVKVFSGFSWNNSDPLLDKIEMRILPVIRARYEGSDTSTRFFCTDSGIDNCYKEVDFELDSSLRVSVNTPTSLGGFFMGRISEPIVKQTLNLETSQNEIQLTGSPTRVPTISVKIPETATIPANLDAIRRGEGNNYPSYDGGWNEQFEFATRYSNDRVTRYSTQWGVYAMSPAFSSYVQCARAVKGFLGTGTTNAMRYDFNPPVFSDGAFTFKLSGQHFQPDGVTLELGFYELVLNSDFAKCLYKTNKVPLVAKIEIISANGEKNITTTTSQERDGWFKLQIAALTFSTKTIKISLTPEQPKEIAPIVESPKVISAIPKVSKTITCTKGTKIKAVKGVKPVCPKGWKIAKKS